MTIGSPKFFYTLHYWYTSVENLQTVSFLEKKGSFFFYQRMSEKHAKVEFFKKKADLFKILFFHFFHGVFREALKKNYWICEHAHASFWPPPPPTVRALGYFILQCLFFIYYWGCLVRCERDFVNFWVNFDKLMTNLN